MATNLPIEVIDNSGKMVSTSKSSLVTEIVAALPAGFTKGIAAPWLEYQKIEKQAELCKAAMDHQTTERGKLLDFGLELAKVGEMTDERFTAIMMSYNKKSY